MTPGNQAVLPTCECPSPFQFIVELIGSAGWPVAVAFAVVLLGVLFHDPIADFIERIETIVVAGVAIRLSQPNSQQ